MRRLGLLALVVPALAVSACARPAVSPTAAVVRSPVAVVIAQESRTTPRFGRVLDLWRVSLSGGEATTLPVEAALQPPPRLSPDGNRLLYAPAAEGRGTLRLIDISSTADSQVSTAPLQSFGWTPDGRIVVVSGGRPARPVFFGPSRLENVSVEVTGGAHSAVARFSSAEASSVTAISLVAGDGRFVYLIASDSSPNFTGQSLWRIDMRDRSLTDLYDLRPRGLSFSPYDTIPVEDWRPPLRPATLLQVGVPLEETQPMGHPDGTGTLEYPELQRVRIFRLADVHLLRTFEVTPAPSYNDDREPVYADDLSRYAVAAVSGRGLRTIWEADTQTGSTPNALVRGTKTSPKPMPLGYAGPDLVYRSVEASRLVVGLWRRSTETTRQLAKLEPMEDSALPWYPQVMMLGVQYAR